MKRRRFKVSFEGEGVIELDDTVIEVVDDEWRSRFGGLDSVSDIVAHIAHSLVIDGLSLSELDGWADQSDESAFVLEDVYWYTSVEEEKS